MKSNPIPKRAKIACWVIGGLALVASPFVWDHFGYPVGFKIQNRNVDPFAHPFEAPEWRRAFDFFIDDLREKRIERLQKLQKRDRTERYQSLDLTKGEWAFLAIRENYSERVQAAGRISFLDDGTAVARPPLFNLDNDSEEESLKYQIKGSTITLSTAFDATELDLDQISEGRIQFSYPLAWSASDYFQRLHLFNPDQKHWYTNLTLEEWILNVNESRKKP